MASNLHLSLLLTSLFFFHLSSARFYPNADDALLHTVCTDAPDKPFCFQTFKNDPRTPAADLDGLCLIAVSLITDHATKTSDKIRGLLDHATDPVTINRLNFCLLNYGDAVSKFHEAYTSASAKTYPDVLAKIGHGFYNATTCNDVFRSGPPIQTSPFIADTQMLLKLVELPNLVFEHIH